MKITIESVPHDKQRYPTVGDWQWDTDGNLIIKVSEFWDKRYMSLVALHELVEALLCQEREITDEVVTAFDLAHLDSPDPGLDADAPYHQEHMTADLVERLVAQELGVNWKQYSQEVDAL